MLDLWSCEFHHNRYLIVAMLVNHVVSLNVLTCFVNEFLSLSLFLVLLVQMLITHPNWHRPVFRDQRSNLFAFNLWHRSTKRSSLLFHRKPAGTSCKNSWTVVKTNMQLATRKTPLCHIHPVAKTQWENERNTHIIHTNLQINLKVIVQEKLPESDRE